MRRSVFILLMFWFDCKITMFFLKMARKRTFSHFFFEKKCVFVPKSLIWLHNFNPDKVLLRPDAAKVTSGRSKSYVVT